MHEYAEVRRPLREDGVVLPVQQDQQVQPGGHPGDPGPRQVPRQPGEQRVPPAPLPGAHQPQARATGVAAGLHLLILLDGESDDTDRKSVV